MSNKTEADAIAEIVAESTTAEVHQVEVKNANAEENQIDFVTIPKGMKIESLRPLLEEKMSKPLWRKGTAKTYRLSSLIKLTNRFKDENTVLFAHAKVNNHNINASLTSVIDYHPESPDKTNAQWCQHRITYDFPVSKELQTWLEYNGEKMSQADFAAFLEDRVTDLIIPSEEDRNMLSDLKPKFADPIEVLELSRDLEIHANNQFKQKVKLQTGETELKFTSEHTDSANQPVSVPDFFILGIPVFEMGEPRKIAVRLRYRAGGGSVVWFYELYRIDKVLDEAFDSACLEAQEGCDVPLYLGEPEAQ